MTWDEHMSMYKTPLYIYIYINSIDTRFNLYIDRFDIKSKTDMKNNISMYVCVCVCIYI